MLHQPPFLLKVELSCIHFCGGVSGFTSWSFLWSLRSKLFQTYVFTGIFICDRSSENSVILESIELGGSIQITMTNTMLMAGQTINCSCRWFSSEYSTQHKPTASPIDWFLTIVVFHLWTCSSLSRSVLKLVPRSGHNTQAEPNQCKVRYNNYLPWFRNYTSKIAFAIFVTASYYWLIFSLHSTNIPRPFSQVPLSSHVFHILFMYICFLFSKTVTL